MLGDRDRKFLQDVIDSRVVRATRKVKSGDMTYEKAVNDIACGVGYFHNSPPQGWERAHARDRLADEGITDEYYG